MEICVQSVATSLVDRRGRSAANRRSAAAIVMLALGIATVAHAAEDDRVTAGVRVTEDARPVALPGLGPDEDRPRNRAGQSGIRLLRSEPGVELAGIYRHGGHPYHFTARLLDDGARLAVVRRVDGEEVARAYHGADGSLAIILGGVPVRGLHLLEPAQRQMAAALIASEEAAALRDLALEIGCAEPSEESRPLRNVLQAIVIDGLQPWGLKIDAAAVEGVAERCPVRCDAPLERDGLMLLCGQALFRLRPAGEKNHDNCFGACGSGCSTCSMSQSWCQGEDLHEVYDCYTEECCVDHDECNRQGWCAEQFGHTCDPLCHLAGFYSGCAIHAFTNADFYSYKNVAYKHVYRSHWMCLR